MSILRRRALIEQGNSIPYWYNIDEDWDYIIDQTGKYENPIIVNEDNLYNNKLRSISDIRDMSKLVVGHYDETSAKLIWEPLDDSDGKIVKHATSAYPININIFDYLNEYPTADTFMKLPEFWWRCWDINDNSEIVAFKFVTEEPTDNNTWHHWDGNIFIGAYKGHIDEINNVKILRSSQSSKITTNLTHDDFYNAARNKGAGYRCLTYEAHQMMALLLFGFNKTSFDDDYKSYGSYPTYTGFFSAIKNDGTAVFWGLEYWNSHQEEFIDNLEGTGNSVTVNNNIFVGGIYDINKNLIRTCRSNGVSDVINRMIMVLGEYADLIAVGISNKQLYSGYCSSKPTNNLYYAIRGDSITGLKINIPSEQIDSHITSRLQYEGNNEQYNGLNPPSITVSSYTIDQTGPYNTKPKDMITFNTDNKVILDIRANSDFYALENKDWGTSTPEFIKMSKTNKLRTIRGTTLDANNYDIFMKLPEFWWKCENVENNEDKVKFSFTMTNPNDNTWFHWEGNTFIGVYRSYYENNKLYSRSGVTPNKIYGTFNEHKQTARNRGNGFQLLTYEVSQILAILGYGYFGTLGFYDVYNSKYTNIYANELNTGGLNTSGFTDECIEKKYYNYWGLENWGIPYSGIRTQELIDNLKIRSEDGKWYADILDYNDNLIRSVQINCRIYVTSGSVPYITKVVFGNYGDIFPKETDGGKYGIRCYDCEQAIYEFQDSPLYKYDNITGLSSKTDTHPYSNDYSRLVYKGNYTIGEEFQV